MPPKSLVALHTFPRATGNRRDHLASEKGPSSEASVAVAIEDAYRDGIKRAAAFVDEKGQRELAAMVRRLAEESR